MGAMSTGTFEWDDNKDADKQLKHQVSFHAAQAAFVDPHRVIARDLAHSGVEERFYCFGKAAAGMLTVRFTYRKNVIRITGAGFGPKERLFMTKKIVYTDEPLGELEVLRDFLPSPAELAFREDGVKVTLSLSKSSVDFFKSEAAKHQTQYQRMIRRLLDSYVNAQSSGATSAPQVRAMVGKTKAVES